MRRLVPMLATEDLLDSQQVADLLGLSHRNSVTTYGRRYRDFPRPVVVRSGGRVRLWARDDVVSWRDGGTQRHPEPAVNAGQRQLIIEATRRLLLAEPFGQLSVRRIADEAGVPHPVLYRHVRTKQELFELVVEDAIRRIWVAMDEVQNPTWRGYVPEVVRVVLANQEFVRVFVLWLIEGGGSELFAEIAIMPRMLAALRADPACDGSGDITAEAAVAGAAAMLIGAVAFEPRIHMLGPDLVGAEALTRSAIAVFELALASPSPEPAERSDH